MQEQIKRELHKIYLIMEQEDGSYEETYESEMIVRNNLKTILPLQLLRVDGKLQLQYEITACRTLKSCAEEVKLSEKSIRSLLEDIELLDRETKEYLLDMEKVLLDPEHIYFQDEKFYFCYCPWEKKDAKNALQGLFEELLGMLDYRDAKGVELAYHMYQNSCQDHFSLQELLTEYGKALDEREGLPEEEVLWEEEPEAVGERMLKKQGAAGFWDRILQLFMKQKEEKPAEKRATEDERIREYFEEPEAFNVQMLQDQTVLLRRPPQKTWRLHPQSGEFSEFWIREERFVIGKKKEMVDGWIARDTISRVHSTFYVREGRLFVTDANSTNGTFVNGMAVEPGQEVEIFAGDRILFADVGYECYNSL